MPSRASFQEEQIAPPARHSDDPADGIPWSVLKDLATGCNQDYLSDSRDASMFRDMPNQAMTSDMDPVQSLKDGVPILYYEEDDHSFERRVLKADDELHFLYVLLSTQGKTPTAPLMSVPLSQIRQVYVMDEALHICEQYGVHDHNLKLDSAVVVYYDLEHDTAGGTDLEQEMPPLHKLFILMAAPQQQLPRMIQACTEQLATVKFRRKVKENALRVDTVMLQDPKVLLDRTAESYGFNVSFRNDNSSRELPMPGDRFEGVERDSLERLLCDIERKLYTEWRLLDVMRVMYVLRDAAYLRRSVTFIGPDIFQNRLDEFVRDKRNIDKLLPTDEAFRNAVHEVDSALEELNEHKSEDDRRYTEASSRSVLLAMKQCLQLEGDHARIERDREFEEDDGDVDPIADRGISQPPGGSQESARSQVGSSVPGETARLASPSPDGAQGGDSAEKTVQDPEYGDASFGGRNKQSPARQCATDKNCTMQ